MALTLIKLGDVAQENSWILINVECGDNVLKLEIKGELSATKSLFSSDEKKYLEDKIRLIDGSIEIFSQEQEGKNIAGLHLTVPVNRDTQPKISRIGSYSYKEIKLHLLPFVPITPDPWNDPLKRIVIEQWFEALDPVSQLSSKLPETKEQIRSYLEKLRKEIEAHRS